MASIGSGPSHFEHSIVHQDQVTPALLHPFQRLTCVTSGYNLISAPFNHELQHSYGLWVVVYIENGSLIPGLPAPPPVWDFRLPESSSGSSLVGGWSADRAYGRSMSPAFAVFPVSAIAFSVT
jgi:hypothetical protein